MYKTLLPALIFIFPLLSNGQNGGEVIYIDKEKPFSKVDFQWDEDGDLDILINSNIERGLTSVDSFRYIPADKLIITRLAGEIDWIDNAQERTDPIESNEILRISENTFRIKILGTRTPLGEKLQRSDRWKSCRFVVHYEIDKVGHEWAKIPIYANKSSIAEERRNELTLKFVSLSKKKGDDKAILNLSATRADFVARQTEILHPVSKNVVGRSVPSSNSVDEGKSIQLTLQLYSPIDDETNYLINVYYSLGGVNHGYQSFESTIAIEPSFELISVTNKQTGEPLERRLKLIRNEDLVILVSAGILDPEVFDLRSAFLEVRVKEPTHAGDNTPPPVQKLFFRGSDQEFRLNFKDALDGIYSLQVYGEARTHAGSVIRLSGNNEFLIHRDTRNVVESLQFSYTDENYKMSFGLKNEVLAEDVMGIPEGGIPILSLKERTEDGSFAYTITGDIRSFPQNDFAKVTLKVSGNVIFEFEFFVFDKGQLEETVQKSLDRQLRKIEEKERPDFINKNALTIKNSLVNSVATELESKATKKVSNKPDFRKHLESVVDDYVEYLGNITKEKAKEKKFWDSLGGKVVKTIGGMALKYLGIVVV